MEAERIDIEPEGETRREDIAERKRNLVRYEAYNDSSRLTDEDHVHCSPTTGEREDSIAFDIQPRCDGPAKIPRGVHFGLCSFLSTRRYARPDFSSPALTDRRSILGGLNLDRQHAIRPPKSDQPCNSPGRSGTMGVLV